jgi:hypothetical protein
MAQGLKSPAWPDPSLNAPRLDSARPQFKPGSALAPTGGFAYTTPDPAARDLSAGFYQPLSDRLSTLLETTQANGWGLGRERSTLGEVAASLGEGWGVRAGVRHSELGLQDLPMRSPSLAPNGTADVGMLTLERSWSRYRGAYTYYAGRSDSGALASGHKLQLHYFYGERSSVGLAYRYGQPLDPLAAGYVPGVTETSNVGVTGEHWLSGNWSFKYDALMEEYGGQGLKPELRLGLRLQF